MSFGVGELSDCSVRSRAGGSAQSWSGSSPLNSSMALGESHSIIQGAAMLDWQSAIRTRLVRLAVPLCALSILSASYACQRRTQRATFSPVAETCYRLAFIPAAFVDSVPSLSGQKLADLVFLAQAGFDSTWHLAFATDTGGASAELLSKSVEISGRR